LSEKEAVVATGCSCSLLWSKNWTVLAEAPSALLPGIIHMNSMEWGMDSIELVMDSIEWCMDSTLIPYNFQMDSIPFSEWSPYGIHVE